MARLIVGLTGAFGSGTTFLADNFFAKMGFTKYSLSEVLKEKYVEGKGVPHTSRHDLQEFGNKLRENDSSILAKEVDNKYILKCEQDENIVVDSIRNPAEIKFFREKYPEFILVGVFADYEIRWERVKDTYSGSKDSFDADEQKDKGTFEPQYGQRISDCFFESDLILSNNDSISIEGENQSYRNMAR